MAGIRIRHTTRRSRTVVVEDVRAPYRRGALLVPYLCAECRNPDGSAKSHRFKATHLRLDEDGTTIVAPELWRALSAIPGAHGFERVNVVESPPPQRLIVPVVDRRAVALAPSAVPPLGGVK